MCSLVDLAIEPIHEKLFLDLKFGQNEIKIVIFGRKNSIVYGINLVAMNLLDFS